MEIVVHSKNT